MKLPKNFKKNISKYFYDKEIKLYNSKISTDEEGWVNVVKDTESDTFNGNVSFDNLAQVQEDYGLAEKIDIAISTHKDIALGSLIEYDSVLYKIVSSVPFDTHNFLMGSKWS